MSLEKKISRIQNLASLQPDKRWEKTTKFDLLDEISSQNRLKQAYELSNIQKIDLFAMRVFNRVTPSANRVLASFLVFMMFFGVNIAAQASVPGEPLWPVKRSIEEVELSFTFSPVKKTEVYIKHVNERLNEIDKILETQIEVKEVEAQTNQEVAIKQAVSHLGQDIASVDSSLKIVKEEKKAIEVVELVKKVTTITKQAIDNLEVKIKDTSSIVIGEALDSAKESQVEVETAAVDLAIEIHDGLVAAEALETPVEEVNTDINTEETPVEEVNTDINTEETPVEEVNTDINTEETPVKEGVSEELEAVRLIVAEIVAEQIENLANQIGTTQEEVGNIVEEKLIELAEIVENPELSQGKEDKEIVEGSEQSIEEQQIVDTIEDIDNVKENPEAAIIILDEAKSLLEEGSFKDAIEKVSKSKELNAKSDVILEKLNDLQVVTGEIIVENKDNVLEEGLIEPIVDGQEAEILLETSTSTVAIEPIEDVEEDVEKTKEEEVVL